MVNFIFIFLWVIGKKKIGLLMGEVIEVDCPRIKALFTCFCSSIKNTNLCFIGFVVGLGFGMCLATSRSYFFFSFAFGVSCTLPLFLFATHFIRLFLYHRKKSKRAHRTKGRSLEWIPGTLIRMKTDIYSLILCFSCAITLLKN